MININAKRIQIKE